MKTILIFLIFAATTTQCFAKKTYTKEDILGVWELTKFVSIDSSGIESNWCEGSNGTIAYLPGLMSVSINCQEVAPESGAEKIGGYLFYSGPFEVDAKTNEVVHRVQNYSHKALHQVYRRTIEMENENHLRLIGFLGEGKKAVVEWKRVEKFSYNSHFLTGVWKLVASENDVEGSDKKIPFCTGFYGTILYTPGGYNAVSINCAEKKDASVNEPADIFGRRFFYAGKYKIDGDIVIQTPENSSVLELISKPALREMSLKGAVLTLSGTNGSKFRAIWKKTSSFIEL